MNLLNEIDKIKEYFPNHSKCTIRTFCLLALSILSLRTACLYKCKDKVGQLTGNTKVSFYVHYKKLLRFFCIKQIEAFCDGIFLFLLSLKEVSSSYIIIDRTNWKFGKKNINVFTLGVMVCRCFIPLCWMQLDKRGNSNFAERKSLVNRFVSLWVKAGRSRAESILIADREFIGQQWLEYLKDMQLSFILRLRENMYFDLQVYATGKKRKSLKSFHKHIEQFGVYAIPMELNGSIYSIVMTKNLKNDYKEPYIYFITDLDNAYAVLEHYGKRWSIECCFKHLKRNGFNLESMNFKDDKKIELMVGVVCVGYVLAVQEGQIAHLKKPIPIKRYKDGNFYL